MGQTFGHLKKKEKKPRTSSFLVRFQTPPFPNLRANYCHIFLHAGREGKKHGREREIWPAFHLHIIFPGISIRRGKIWVAFEAFLLGVIDFVFFREKSSLSCPKVQCHPILPGDRWTQLMQNRWTREERRKNRGKKVRELPSIINTGSPQSPGLLCALFAFIP